MESRVASIFQHQTSTGSVETTLYSNHGRDDGPTHHGSSGHCSNRGCCLVRGRSEKWATNHNTRDWDISGGTDDGSRTPLIMASGYQRTNATQSRNRARNLARTTTGYGDNHTTSTSTSPVVWNDVFTTNAGPGVTEGALWREKCQTTVQRSARISTLTGDDVTAGTLSKSHGVSRDVYCVFYGRRGGGRGAWGRRRRGSGRGASRDRDDRGGNHAEYQTASPNETVSGVVIQN